MSASLHGSTNDLYYTAYVRLNDFLAHKSSKFDAATVRAAALIAFNAEQRRLQQNPNQPASTTASVLGFAANVNPRRSVPTPGTIRRVLDDAMPSSLKHLDGTFPVVPASADISVAACVSTVATAPTSAESRDALRIYHAAIHDLTTPERQADFDRTNPVAYAARTGTPCHDFSDED